MRKRQHPWGQALLQHSVIISIIFALTIILAGCGHNASAAQHSSSASSTNQVVKKSHKGQKVSSIKFTGRQQIKMRHYDNLDLIDDWAIFTFNGKKLTAMTETNLYDETMEPEFKRKADIADLKKTEASYAKSSQFQYTVKEQKKNVYLVTLVYNLKKYPPKDLLSDQLLKYGKYNAKYLLQVFAKMGYKMQ